jgi:cyclopropane-fatty-acyl-phospholipid synthase
MSSRGLADFVTDLLGDDLPIRIEFADGSAVGPRSGDAPAVVHVRSDDALRRIVSAPGELGFSRAYVVGDLEVEGDIYSVIGLRTRLPNPKLTPRQWVQAAKLLRPSDFRLLPPPPEEAHQRGRLHTRRRDADAISHHYDVSNRFYEMVLGPAMTYSCALWETPDTGLEAAQAAKLELICQKLALRPGMRLLDIGCGWGSMVRHAVRHHGVEAVGVTISAEQADWARHRVAQEGLDDRIEIRVQDYRDVRDGPFDAISSIGMFEHVGSARLAEYFRCVHSLLAEDGRFLNHAIARPPGARPGFAKRSFVQRYVFPDGELLEVGSVVSAMQSAGFEVRHLENLREHYALTLRAWVRNLEDNWDAAVAEVGANRARIWRLYMAGSALGFEEGRISVDQVLGLRDPETAPFPLRPDWDASPHALDLRS